MEILLWLAPPAAVTVAAMCWAARAGRDTRAVADPEVLARRLERALRRAGPAPYAARTPVRDRSTGVAVRPSRAPRPSPAAEPRSRRAS